MDWTGCPLVERDPEKLGGVPIVKDTRMQADGILENYEGGLSIAEISYQFGISQSVIEELLAFAASHSREIAS